MDKNKKQKENKNDKVDKPEKEKHYLLKKYEKITTPSEFNEYDIKDLDQLNIICSHAIYILYDGKLKKDTPIFALKMRFFDKKYLGIIKKQPIFRIKSKYLVPRIGYAYDYTSNSFYTIYEKNGQTLSFNDFYNYDSLYHGDLIKLYFYNIIMKLVHRIKKKIKDKFKIGILDPTLFVINLQEEVPLKMLDFYFFNYYTLNNTDKSMDFIRPIFGCYDLSDNKANDMTTLKLFLAKCFFNENYQNYDFYVLIMEYYRDLNSKCLNEFYEKLKNMIKNKDIYNFIESWEPERIQERFGKEVSNYFDHFYEKAFQPMYDNIVQKNKCSSEKCENPSVILDFKCMEPYCKDCKKKHICRGEIFNEITKINNCISAVEKEIERIKEKADIDDNQTDGASVLSDGSKERFRKDKNINDLSVYEDYSENLFLKHKAIKKYLIYIWKKVETRQTHLNEMIEFMEKTFRSKFEIQIKLLEDLMEKYKTESDEIMSKKISEEIINCENFLENTKKFIIDIGNYSKIINSLSKFNPLSFTYIENLENYFNTIIKDNIKVVYDNFVNHLTNILKDNIKAEKKNLILSNITDNSNDFTFYVPNFGTNKMTKFSNIEYNELKISYHKSVTSVVFSGKINDKKFPLESRYVRIKKCLIITGGYYDIVNLGEIRQTLLVDLEKLKVKTMSPMFKTRKSHSMIVYNDFYAIAVGGEDNDSVEIYYFLTDTWNELVPRLNQKRANSSLFILNDSYLYCFGGENKGRMINSIETLHLNTKRNNSEYWKLLKFKQKFETSFEGANIGIIVKNNENHILLLGGRNIDERDGILVNKSNIYEFSFNSYKIKSLDIEINNHLYFLENNFLKIQNIEDYQFQVGYNDEGSPSLFHFKQI